MTDMDEIRGLVGDYGAAEFRAGRFVESGSTTRSAACRDADDKRSALLQRVEALREERDEARAAQKRAEEERDEAKRCEARIGDSHVALLHRVEAAESALAALRAAPRGCTACGSGFRNVEEWRAALAPAPPETPAPEGCATDRYVEVPGDTVIRCEYVFQPQGFRCTRFTHAQGAHDHDSDAAALWNGLSYWYRKAKELAASPASAPSRGSGDGSYEWAYTESLDILQAALDGLPEAEADLPMPRMARQAAAAIMRLRGAPSPTSTDPEEIQP